jgi:hypothetical protein
MNRTITGIVSNLVFGREGLQLIAVAQGRISRISPLSPKDAEAAFRRDAGLLDARDKLVLPAFIDSHTHALAAARFLYEIEVFAAAGADSLIELIKSSPLANADFILAGRLNAAGWTRGEQQRIAPMLDAAFPAKPCLVKSVEQHSCFANSAAWRALDIAGIAQRAGVQAAEAAAMREDGRIHGTLYEELTTPLYDTFTLESRREALARFLDGLPRLGVGGLHALVGYGSNPAEDIRVTMEAASARQDLDMTVWPRVQDISLVKELGLPRIGGCILVDGAIGARTAALRQPYDDDPSNTGVLYFTQYEFTRFAEECAAAGLQLCVHAIGDAAIEQGLVAYEALAAKYNLHALRPRIDHWCLATPSQCARAAKLGVASGMQPAFDHFWGGAQGAYYRALTGRALAANALKTALDAGMIIGGGSDAPITPLDPRLGVHAACFHTNERERLSFSEAIRLFTEGSASLSKHEHEVGRLAEGFAADFAIFAGDTGAGNIHQREALLTVHRGRVVWDAAAAG